MKRFLRSPTTKVRAERPYDHQQNVPSTLRFHTVGHGSLCSTSPASGGRNACPRVVEPWRIGIGPITPRRAALDQMDMQDALALLLLRASHLTSLAWVGTYSLAGEYCTRAYRFVDRSEFYHVL